MSAFCVFGTSRSVAKARATKRVEESVRVKKLKLTPEQFEAEVAEVAAAIFKKSGRVKISNLFDAPQFANDFIRAGVSADHICRAHVRARIDSGEINKKTGKPRMTWTEYRE